MRKRYRDVGTHMESYGKMHTLDDVVTVLPIRPNGINHDLGLSDCGLDRLIVPNVYNENPNFIKLKLSLEVFQFLL